ncbi:hypothetical protein FQN60_012654, partial [Etheostoma spectabile]
GSHVGLETVLLSVCKPLQPNHLQSIQRHQTFLQDERRWAASQLFILNKRSTAEAATPIMAVVRFYSNEVVSGRAIQRAAKLYPQLSITTELCYNVELTGCQRLSAEQTEVLLWLFRPPLQAEPLSEEPNLTEGSGEKLVEIGPRLNFSTAWSTNAVSICQSAGLTNVTRVELSRRFLIKPKNGENVNELDGDTKKLIACLYDSMTECIYQHPITSFTVETKPQPVFEVDILGKGRAALEMANDNLVLQLAVSTLSLLMEVIMSHDA